MTIRLFASLRERFGTDATELPWDASLVCVAALVERLGQERGPDWRALGEPPILVAVNHAMAAATTGLRDGDEVAFLPPVTGG